MKGSPQAFSLLADLTIKDVTKEVLFNGKITGFLVRTEGIKDTAGDNTAKAEDKTP